MEVQAQTQSERLEKPKFRQPLYAKAPLGGISESQVNRWNEKNQPEKFEAGLDRGLRSWAALRRSLAAVQAGDLVIPETIPTRIKYRSGRTYYDKSVVRMTGAFLSEVLEEMAERKEAAERVKQEGGAPATVVVDPPEAPDGDDAASKGSNDDSDDDSDDEDHSNSKKATAAENALPAHSRSPPLSAIKSLKPPDVNIIRPTFPALTIAQFANLLKTAPAREALMCAYHHFHWRYFDLAICYPGINIDMNISGRTGKTLLFLAVENGDVERVEHLLEKGANPNARDHRGDTPLHLCMRHPVVFHPRTIATMLINKGANVNAQNKRGTTPLHRAVLLGLLDYVELLLKRRAKVFIFDKNGKLPLHYAGINEVRVAKLMNQNVRFCGKRQHEEMWAFIMSRQFVPGIFSIVASACVVCKRKSHDCAALKTSNFRYWIYVHEIMAKKKTEKSQ